MLIATRILYLTRVLLKVSKYYFVSSVKHYNTYRFIEIPYQKFK